MRVRLLVVGALTTTGRGRVSVANTYLPYFFIRLCLLLDNIFYNVATVKIQFSDWKVFSYFWLTVI